MGGLLARIFTNTVGYRNPDNCFQGYFRKLVTLDSPHFGSPLADLLFALRQDVVFGTIAAQLFDLIGRPIDEGAIEDLRVLSPAILAMGPGQAPSHALIGIGGTEALIDLLGPSGAFYRLVNFFAAVTGSGLFEGLQHDSIVARPSQEGGLTTALSGPFGDDDGLHFGVSWLDVEGNTGSDLYSDEMLGSAVMLGLLDTPLVEPGVWELFPTPTLVAEFLTRPRLRSDDTEERREQAPARLEAGAGIQITAPAPGTEVESGASVLVTVEATGGARIDEVIVVGPDTAETDATAPFEVMLSIPLDALGATPIQASGKNAQGEFFLSAEVVLQAVPAATLTGIRLALLARPEGR